MKTIDLIKQNKENSKNNKVQLNLDFCELVGDTIKERHETLVFEIALKSREHLLDYFHNEYADVDFAKLTRIERTAIESERQSSFYWIWASPEISSIFETAINFVPTPSSEFLEEDEQYLCGYYDLLGTKWYVVKDYAQQIDKFIVGTSRADTDSVNCEFEFKNFCVN